MRYWKLFILICGIAVTSVAPANAQLNLNRTRFTDPAVLIQNKNVQEHLNLKEEVRESVLQIPILIRQAADKDHKALVDIKDSAERERKKQEVRRLTLAEGQKELKRILTPEQHKRIDQLALQVSDFQAFEREEIKQALKLSAEQQNALGAVGTIAKAEMAAAIAGANRGGGNLQAMWQASKPARKKAMHDSVAVLTPDQQRLWNDMVGEPFDFALERPGKDQLPALKDAPPPATKEQKADPKWVAQQIKDWKPTTKEKNFDEIGWHTTLVEATQEAKKHTRGLFIFVVDGVLGTGRC